MIPGGSLDGFVYRILYDRIEKRHTPELFGEDHLKIA
jgi:hypothetical protein